MTDHSKQLTLWLLAAVSAPIAHFSGCGWVTAALTAAAVLPLTLIPKSWEGMPRLLAFVEILGFGAAAGMLLRCSAACWPSDNDLAVPLTLLALAVWAGTAAKRIGAVLALCIGLLAIPIAAVVPARMEPDWLKPRVMPWSPGLALTLLLLNLPAAAERKDRGSVFALTVLICAAVQGCLSPWVAASVPDPEYQTARTLGYLEPIAAAAMTLGWFAVTTLLLQSAAKIADGSGIRRKTASVLVAGTATFFVLLQVQPLGTKTMVLASFLWVLIPFFLFLKKVKKSA